ncbi:hypothetical protein ACLB2K_062621 [Fragaria x ananassa]
MLVSFVLLGVNLFRSMLVRGLEWFESYFRWLSGMKACIVFFDEVEAIGGTRFDDGVNIKKCMHRSRMYAIRARRKTVTEKDFLDAVNMVIKGYQKFSATPKYMVYN